MNIKLLYIVFLITCIFHGISGKKKSGPLAENVILIIADDIGMEYLELFRFAFENKAVTKFPKTPVLDELAKNGIRFPNFYTNPTCSATRVSILTGRYGFRTGVGCPAGLGDGPGIAETEMTIPKALSEFDINSAIFGKWHMSLSKDGYDMPLKMGFNTYRGIFDGGVNNYYKWNITENGAKPKETKKYITQLMTDHAIEFLKANQTDPFFLWMAYYAPHVPLHRPPKDLIYTSEYKELLNINPLLEEVDPIPYLYAMVESLDHEIGRLLDALEDDVRKKTTIIFISDNGNISEIVAYDDKNPYESNRVKQTVYEGGIRMPLIISGAGVKDPNRINIDLVNSVDLYSTIGEILGVDMESNSLWDIILHTLRIRKKNYIDSISLVDVMQDKKASHERIFALSEQFGNCKNENFDLKQQRSIRNYEYKYIINLEKKKEELYYLIDDPYEETNLLTSKGKVKDNLKSDFKNDFETNLKELKEMLEDLLETEE